MTKKTARIKVVADGKVQYVDVDVTVDDPPAKSTPSTPSGTPSATPTPARKSPLGCLLVPVLIIGAVFLMVVAASFVNSRQSVPSTPVVNVQGTLAADQAFSAISVTVTNNHCEGSSNCADYTITLENGAFYERWQPTFHFQSGKTSIGYCDYSANSASCFLSKNGIDLNDDPATKVCFEIKTGLVYNNGSQVDTTQFCKDITN